MHNPKHLRACLWLLFATSIWGISFPFVKAILLAQEQLVPDGRSVFFASLGTVVRFGVAGLLIALFAIRTLPRLTRNEIAQGVGLGFFGGLGILFQMDALAHTDASTSAFLTQFYCIIIPAWVAWRQRAAPKVAVIASLVLVVIGMAILSRFDWRQFKMGRGEAETILCALFFAGQILWLERPRYAGNSATHFTVVMFATIVILIAPVAIFTAPSSHAIVRAYASVEVLSLMGVLTLACTLAAYMLMNIWQRHVTATEAGLIYCVEPICASLFAVVVPGWLSGFAGIDYANERITMNLLIGGGLITAANLLIQIEAMRRRRKAVTGSQSE
jgi:drug/metabolite transporter (DMT)-like permease